MRDARHLRAVWRGLALVALTVGCAGEPEPDVCALKALSRGGAFVLHGAPVWTRPIPPASCRLQDPAPEWDASRGSVAFTCTSTVEASSERYQVEFTSRLRPGWVPTLPWGELVTLVHRGLEAEAHRGAAFYDRQGGLVFAGLAASHLPGGFPAILTPPEADFFPGLRFEAGEPNCSMLPLGSCKVREEQAVQPLIVRVAATARTEPPQWFEVPDEAEVRVGGLSVLVEQAEAFDGQCVFPSAARGYTILVTPDL